MKQKIHLSTIDYICLAFVIIAIIGYCRGYSKDADSSKQAEIEAAYSEGYAQGYHDAENGFSYDEDR